MVVIKLEGHTACDRDEAGRLIGDKHLTPMRFARTGADICIFH